MTLSILLAARGRPELLKRTLEITLPNIVRHDTRLTVLLDEDDADDRRVALSFAPLVTVSVAPREDTLGAKYNRGLKIAPGSVYLAMVDYAPHVTRGFDQKILDAASVLEDGIGVVYNRMANLSFPAMNAVTHGLVKRMGHLYAPLFPYWFVDHWLDDIARMIGRIAWADVQLDTSARAAQPDKPWTQEYREPAYWASFYDALAPLRREMAQAIIDDPEFHETPARKALLRQSYPGIEERSVMVNAHVRTMPDAGLPHDARYLRVKAQAARILQEIYQDVMVRASKAKAA